MRGGNPISTLQGGKMSTRTPTWHTLARSVVRPNETLTTAEMLDRAQLSGWNVRKEPVIYPAGVKSLSKDFYVLRDTANGVESMSVVGDKYQPYQNEEMLAFADNLLDGGAKWESAGFFKQGRVIFGALTIDHEFTIAGANDTTKTYLLVSSSHDGSSSIRACVTPVRVICQNTLSLAFKKATQSWSVRHTAGTAGRMEEARTALDLTHKYMDEFSILANDLFNQEITNQKFDEIYETIYPKPADDAKASLTRWNNNFDLTRGLYLSAETNANITGTKWGALNAMTERIDWFRNGDKPMTEGMSASASGFETSIQQEKARILEVVSAL